MKSVSKLLWGLVLIVLGVILGTNALGVTDIDIFFDGWWTLFIIVPCFIDLFKEADKTGNIIGLAIGISLLLACQDIINFEIIWKLMLPFILVMLGLSLIFKDLLHSKVKKEIKKLNKEKKDDKEYVATFGSCEANFNGVKFEGTDLTAVFGGIKCDLRDAIIKDDEVINATAIFGGVDILVPSGVNVIVSSTSLFGGVDNKSKNVVDSKAKTIYINATCIFGGVDVK